MKTRILPLLVILPSLWSAAQAAPGGPVPDGPPTLAPDPADNVPQITIRRDGKNRVEEYRISGKLYMVKVTPPNGIPYFLVDRGGNGQFVNEGPGEPLAVPQWVIGRF
jgi:hypothetical protein